MFDFVKVAETGMKCCTVVKQSLPVGSASSGGASLAEGERQTMWPWPARKELLTS
jgi:hypothetical protein